MASNLKQGHLRLFKSLPSYEGQCVLLGKLNFTSSVGKLAYLCCCSINAMNMWAFNFLVSMKLLFFYIVCNDLQ